MSGRVPHPQIAVHYDVATHGVAKPVRIVLHDTECGDLAGTTEISGTAAYWQRQGEGLGAQFIIDGDGNIGQGCRGDRITYHVADHNTGSIGIEQIGFARWTTAQWWTRRKQMEAVAHLVAFLADYWNIPLVHSTSHGVCMHKDFHGTHTDPGPGYPFKRVLRRAQAIKRTHTGSGR